MSVALAQPGYPTRPIRIIVPTSPPGGADVVASTPEEFGAYIRAETEKWAKVVQAAGIKPE